MGGTSGKGISVSVTCFGYCFVKFFIKNSIFTLLVFVVLVFLVMFLFFPLRGLLLLYTVKEVRWQLRCQKKKKEISILVATTNVGLG